MPNLKKVVADPLQELGDPISMHMPMRERVQDHHVERAGQQPASSLLTSHR
jgi:hypothetical protein